MQPLKHIVLYQPVVLAITQKIYFYLAQYTFYKLPKTNYPITN